MKDGPLKVAIVGGGCAAMAAAWELSRPEHGGRYQITVFQEGWRLGGKGQRHGRGVSGRIEEHGLHVWLGFYDNAFRMMRECHAELAAQGEGAMFGDWQDAWTPENDVALFSAAEQGGFQRWNVHMPPRPGLPGDPRPAGEVFSLPYYLIQTFHLLRTLLLDTTVEWPGRVRGCGGSFRACGRSAASVAELVRLARFAGAVALAESLGVLSTLLRTATVATGPELLEGVQQAC